MKRYPIFFEPFFLGAILLLSFNCKPRKYLDVNNNHASLTSYSWQESDTSITLFRNAKVIWKFNFDDRAKPYFSPLNTIEGDDLVWLKPDDHPWHYGLWFSWKYINKKNFWEEDRITGQSEGKAVLTKLSKKFTDDFHANIEMEINYSLDENAVVLSEKRVIRISPPDNKGNYFIDWSLNLTNQADTVILNRTPPEKLGGPVYGGYAGLSYRASPQMSQHTFMHAKDWTSKKEQVGYGEKSRWMDLSGILLNSKKKSGLTIFTYPKNGDDQIPWYIYKDGDFAFFNAAILFNDSITIYPNESVKLRYRVLVHSDELTRLEIEEHYNNFTSLKE